MTSKEIDSKQMSNHKKKNSENPESGRRSYKCTFKALNQPNYSLFFIIAHLGENMGLCGLAYFQSGEKILNLVAFL